MVISVSGFLAFIVAFDNFDICVIIRAFVSNHFCGNVFAELTEESTIVFNYLVEIWDL